MPVFPQSTESANGFVPQGTPGMAQDTRLDLPIQPLTNPQPSAPEPSVWGAAFRQDNALAGMFRPAQQFEPAEGYNPYTDKTELQGYEQWASSFTDARSPEETAAIKRRIDDEIEDRKVLSEAGWEGTVASIAAGAIDPVTIASMFIPGGQGRLALRIASHVATGAEAAAVGEIALGSQQETRTWQESAAHVIAGAMLTGVFAGVGELISPATRAAATREVADSLSSAGENATISNAVDAIPNGVSAGAMRINEATLEDLTPVTNGIFGKAAWKAGSYLTPLTRLMESPSKTVRRTTLELAENNFTIQGNLRGIESPVAAETRVRGWRREEAAVVVANKQAYSKFKADGGSMPYTSFREEVGNALRNGDFHENGAVQDAARAMRTVINRVKTEQQKLGLLPPDEELKAIGQTSYFPRVYKVGKIINERDKFRNLLVDWWSRGEKTMTREEAEIAADSTINKIVGARIPQDFTNVFMVKAAGSTKGRTLSVPDKIMQDYLESDANYVLQRHIREAASEVELTRTFGDRTMETQLKDIQDEYDALIRSNPADQAKLAKARERDLRDVTALRDRLTGTYGMADDPSSFFVRAGQFFRQANFITKLGGMAVSAIPDTARGVMVHGFSKDMRGYGAMISGSPAFKASKEEMRKMGVGLETILQTRSRTMGDLVDSSARTTAIEAGMERVTDAFGKLTMMGHFDDINKTVSGMITSDSLLSGSIPAQRMAKLGINSNMAARINAEFKKHGEVIDGWNVGNFEKWDDPYVAGVFQSAVLKDVNNTIITPGIGDTPLWASTPLGKTIFQFKSFTTASYNRATLGGLQEGSAQFYYGTAFQIGLGALTYALKQAANEREVDWSPQKLALEGIDRSGILGPLMEYNNMAEKATGGMVGLGALLGTGTQSRYASRGFVGSALGPTFGLLDTVTDVTAGVLNGDAGDRILHNVRTLVPGNNLFWIAPLINQVDPGMAK